MHRTVGFVGLFLAGGVVFSALQVVPNNITNENFTAVLKYGLTWIDFLVIIGFSGSVLLAMVNSRNIDLHARYMISSTIWVIIPALTRLIYFPMFLVTGVPTPISFTAVIHLCVVLTIVIVMLLILKDYHRERKLFAPYLLTGVGTLFFGVTFTRMSEVTWWVDFCNTLSGN